MYSLKVCFLIVILAICQADVHIELFDNSNIIRETVESSWYCRAASFNQYLTSVLTDVPFPKDCVAPGLSIFSPVDVIFIEETISFNHTIPQGEFNLTETQSVMEPLSVFYKRSNGIKRICYNEDANSCPPNFQVVHNLSSLDLGNKTVIYRPLHLAGSAWDEIEDICEEKVVLGMMAMHLEDRYTTSEVVDMNIIFVTSIVLVLLMAVTVYVVAAIDYGEDTAGLYSKYKQIKSQ